MGQNTLGGLFMKYLFLCLLVTACGKEAYVGTRDLEEHQAVSAVQPVCKPLNEPRIMYHGFACDRRQGEGNIYNYQCVNGYWIQVDCQGRVL